MEYVPMPTSAATRWSKGYWMNSVSEDMVEPIERFTALMAEVDPNFTYQDIKIKFGSYRVYVSAGSFPDPNAHDDEEWDVLNDAYHARSDELRNLAHKLEDELTDIMRRA